MPQDRATWRANAIPSPFKSLDSVVDIWYYAGEYEERMSLKT
jgi:hypothetical protein